MEGPGVVEPSSNTITPTRKLRIGDVVWRAALRAGRRSRQRGTRRPSSVRVLHVSRKRDRARCDDRPRRVEDSIAKDPKPRAKNKDGVQTWSPAGAGVWSAPTVDPARRAIYYTTGNGYAEPGQLTSAAVIAIDMDTGRMRWHFQPIANDVFADGWRAEDPDNPN